MKRLAWIFVLLAAGMTGCATHYYRMGDDGLHLYLLKPEAHSVYLASSLDSFKPHSARRIDGDRWEVRLPSNREFRYFYLVDGTIFIPACRFTERDDFGSKNCIFIPGL